ncbi:hypothetical protein DFH09DRAFT_1101518 [Mycena vulgaris]|nr:hypothetical protein DFH09DRAFT_1101518 [Mycena vulgaris]
MSSSSSIHLAAPAPPPAASHTTGFPLPSSSISRRFVSLYRAHVLIPLSRGREGDVPLAANHPHSPTRNLLHIPCMRPRIALHPARFRSYSDSSSPGLHRRETITPARAAARLVVIRPHTPRELLPYWRCIPPESSLRSLAHLRTDSLARAPTGAHTAPALALALLSQFSPYERSSRSSFPALPAMGADKARAYSAQRVSGHFGRERRAQELQRCMRRKRRSGSIVSAELVNPSHPLDDSATSTAADAPMTKEQIYTQHQLADLGKRGAAYRVHSFRKDKLEHDPLRNQRAQKSARTRAPPSHLQLKLCLERQRPFHKGPEHAPYPGQKSMECRVHNSACRYMVIWFHSSRPRYSSADVDVGLRLAGQGMVLLAVKSGI